MMMFVTMALASVAVFLVAFDLSLDTENYKESADKLDAITDKIASLKKASTFAEHKPGSALSFNNNHCHGSNPGLANKDCKTAVNQQIEQAGANVTKGYAGHIDNSKTPPIMVPYYTKGLCPVNVHWHLGAEHLSVGEYDEAGVGPLDDYALPEKKTRRLAAGSKGVRIGFQCGYYDAKDHKYTNPYKWEHCVDMMVGQTYEVHWPHSSVGACGTPYQYQSPFYDGVFCHYPPGGATTHDNVGVQAQVFTIVNDENYYFPDLFHGMLVAGDFGKDMAYYTGSTTGTSRSNDVCSSYSPITWQVDRKCHLISASSFDKMCADMKAQADDMSMDLYAHGARELPHKGLVAKQAP
jgi:hypothetical protein